MCSNQFEILWLPVRTHTDALLGRWVWVFKLYCRYFANTKSMYKRLCIHVLFIHIIMITIIGKELDDCYDR